MGTAQIILDLLRKGGGRTLAGAALGGAAGYGLSDDGDPAAIAMGAGMGALGGALSRGRYIPEQILPHGPLAADVPAWNATRVPQEDSFTLGQRLRSTGQETISPWYDLSSNPQETANASRALMGGGMGEAQLEADDLIQGARELQDEGLFDAWRSYAGLGTVPRAWDTLREHRMAALQKATMGGAGAVDALAEVRRIDQLLAQRKIATHELQPEQAEAAREAMRVQLGQENFDRVQAFHKRATDKLWAMQQGMRGEGLVDAPEHAMYARRQETGEAYFPAWKRDAETQMLVDDVGTGGQLIQGLRSRGEAAGRAAQSLNVRGVSDIIQELKGSTLPLEDPWIALNVTLQEGIRRIKENRQMRVLTESVTDAKRADGSSFLRPLNPGEAADPARGEGSIAFMVDGQVREFAVPADYANLLQLGTAQSAAAGIKTLGKFQKMNAALITSLNTGFIAANLPKDLTETLLLAMKNPRDTATWMKYYGQSLAASLMDTMPEWRESFIREGGGLSTLTSQLGDQPKWMDLVKPPSGGQWLVERMQHVTQAMEEAPKVAQFRQNLDRGMSPIQSAGDARYWAGSPDYALKGSGTEAIRPWILFWNPAIQGLYRVADLAQSNPGKVAQASAAIGIGYALQQAHNYQYKDENGRAYIEDIPEYERANNIIIFHGKPVTYSNGVTRPEYVKIPLGHYPRMLLAPVRAAVDNMLGEKRAPGIAQSALNVGSNFLPINATIETDDTLSQVGLKAASSLNPALRIPAEMLANESFFSGIPIEGRGLLNLEPQDRFTSSTSDLGRKVAGLYGGSPAKADYAIRNFLPGVGDQLIRLADTGRGQEPMNAAEKWRGMAGFGPALSRFIGGGVSRENSELSEALYGGLNEANQAKASFNRAESMGDADRMQEIYDASGAQMEIAPDLAELTRDLSELRAMREYLAQQPPSPERDQQMLEIAQMSIQLLRGNAPIIDLTGRR